MAEPEILDSLAHKEQKGVIMMTNMNNAAANNNDFGSLIGQAWERVHAGYQSVGQERSRVQEQVNQDVETFKGGLAVIGHKLVEITGLQVFQNSVNAILEAGFTGGNEPALVKMAAEVRNQVQRTIDKYERRGGQEYLSRAMALKEIIGDDGQPIEAQGILGACISGLVWVSRRIAGLLKQWFGINENAPAILKMLAKSVAAIFGFIKAGVKIVVTIVGNVLSYVVAGVIAVAAWIVRTVVSIFNRARAFAQGFGIDEEDLFDEEEEEFDDEEFDEE